MNSLLKISILVCLLISVSCTHLDKNRTSISISQGQDFWTVKYLMPHKAKEFKFQRNTNLFRQENWEVMSEDIKIVQKEGYEYLVSSTPFNKVSLRLRPYLKRTPKDYEFFLKYSDDGYLVFLGHFFIEQVDSKYMTLHLKSKSNIVVNGKAYKNYIKIDDADEKGTYAYFGKNPIVESENFIAVLDSSLPVWITDNLNKYLPKLFKFYDQKFNRKLRQKPTVFFNYSVPKKNVRASGGGVMKEVVQLSVKGSSWKRTSRDKINHIIWLLAHESGHLWNSQLFQNSDQESPWLHEGASDIFAYKYLRYADLISEKELVSKYREALDECIEGLEGKSLISSSKRRAFKNYYSCGSTIMLLVDLAYKEKGKDLFYFLRNVYNHNEDRTYSQQSFHKQLELDGLNQLSKNIQLLCNKDIDDHREFFKTRFAALQGALEH